MSEAIQARATTSSERWVGSEGLSFWARDDGSTVAAGINVLVPAADGRVQRNHTRVDGA